MELSTLAIGGGLTSTPHMSISTMATISSSALYGPTSPTRTYAARMPMVRSGHM